MPGIFLFFITLAVGAASAAVAPEPSLDDAIERLRLVLVQASEYRGPTRSLDPTEQIRRRYEGYANSLLAVKDLDSDDLAIEMLHDLLPKIASVSGNELVEPHRSVTNAIVALHEIVSARQLPGTKDYYIAHTPLMLAPDGGRIVTIHGNFKTINEKHDPYIRIEGRNVDTLDVTDTDIKFEVPQDLVAKADELQFSIIAGTSFRPQEIVLIRETVRDKRKLYIRSRNPLTGSVRWSVPAEDATREFSDSIRHSVFEESRKPRTVYNSFTVEDLLAKSEAYASQDTQFESVKIVDLRWNSRIQKTEFPCETPRTAVNWEPGGIRSYTRVLPESKKLAVYNKRAYSKSDALENIRRPKVKTTEPECTVAVDFYFVPVFQGLLPGASWVTADADQDFTVEYQQSYRLEPPNPAFWRGELSVSYRAGPLSFSERFEIQPRDKSQIVVLPGWQIAIDGARASIRFIEVD